MNIETKQPKSDRETNYLTLHKKWSFPLSLAQMKDKMVLSYLKLKKNSFKPLKQSMFTFTTKAF